MSNAKMWEQRVATWRASGLSAPRFCAGRDFSDTALRYWARKLGVFGRPRSADGRPVAAERVPTVRLARVQVRSAAAPARSASPRSSPAPSPVPSPGGVTIEIDRVRISVERDFDRPTLAAVLDVVARGDRP